MALMNCLDAARALCPYGAKCEPGAEYAAGSLCEGINDRATLDKRRAQDNRAAEVLQGLLEKSMTVYVVPEDRDGLPDLRRSYTVQAVRDSDILAAMAALGKEKEPGISGN